MEKCNSPVENGVQLPMVKMDNEAYEKEQASSPKRSHHKENASSSPQQSPPPSPPPDYSDAVGELDAQAHNGDVQPISPTAPGEVALTVTDQDGEEDPIHVCACEVSNSPCNCRSSPSVNSRTPLTQQVKIIQWTNPKGPLLIGLVACLAAWVVIFFVLAHFNIV